MKSNQVTFILVGIFLLSAVAAACLGQIYNSAVTDLSQASVHLAKMQNSQAFLNGVYRDATEYGKTNPDIMRLVPTPSNTPAAKPAAK